MLGEQDWPRTLLLKLPTQCSGIRHAGVDMGTRLFYWPNLSYRTIRQPVMAA